MKRYFSILSVILFLFQACTEEETKEVNTLKNHSYINIDGRLEIIYTNSAPYKDPELEVIEEKDGRLVCSGIFVKSEDVVNTKVPGTYVLHYNAEDSKGNALPTAIRTVQVVENGASFLNGVYNVACTCTSVIGSSSPTVRQDNYIATITIGSKNFHFELNTLKIGPADVVPFTNLNGNAIEVSYFLNDFNPESCITSGTLSPTKNSFTIESTSIQSFPYESYHCRNVFINSKIHKIN